MYQTPPQYSPVTPYETGRTVRFRVPLLLPLLPLVLFAALFFGGSYALSPEPEVEMQAGFAFAEVDGRDVVLAPYSRHGVRGMFQMMTQDLFQVRLAATDPASGEVLWDTQLSDGLAWEASVLAVPGGGGPVLPGTSQPILGGTVSARFDLRPLNPNGLYLMVGGTTRQIFDALLLGALRRFLDDLLLAGDLRFDVG